MSITFPLTPPAADEDDEFDDEFGDEFEEALRADMIKAGLISGD
ncbi:hypothetical protein [Microbacterium allomyrinae]|nr:hypothetical protein [Microbacterium allomyrinae]